MVRCVICRFTRAWYAGARWMNAGSRHLLGGAVSPGFSGFSWFLLVSPGFAPGFKTRSRMPLLLVLLLVSRRAPGFETRSKTRRTCDICRGVSLRAASIVTTASNAICFGPPSPAPENWLVAARIPPEYASNFSGKNSGGNGSFKRRNG